MVSGMTGGGCCGGVKKSLRAYPALVARVSGGFKNDRRERLRVEQKNANCLPCLSRRRGR